MENSTDVRKKVRKICFYGLFGQGNLGNECTLQAIIYNTRKYFPDAEFKCICSRPEEARVIHNIPTFPIRGRTVCREQDAGFVRLLRRVLIGVPMRIIDWTKAFRTMKDVNMLIVPGTGLLTDAYGVFGWPYDIFKWALIAKSRRCKLLFLSVGAGPIYRPLGRWFIKSSLSLADFRSYRDDSTMRYLKDIGLATNGDRVYPDLAFNLPNAVIPAGGIQKRHRRVVGIGLMSYAGRLSVERPNNAIYAEYLEKLTIFVRWLLAHEYDVRLLIGDFLYDGAVRRDFRDLLKSKNGSTYNEERIIDEPAFCVDQLLSQLSVTDMVVATRFHNVLLALVLGKPVISISFHHKCASLMSGMGLSEYCQDINDLDPDRLIEQFCDMERNAGRLKDLIKLKTEEYRRALDEQYSFIFKGV